MKMKSNENSGPASPNATATDRLTRFENEGVVFKAKLIGFELVLEPRGDKMCQNSFQRLKAIIRGTNSHKRRIVLKISYDGVKVFDEKTNEQLHHHEVSQISYIASDDLDNRTFGYICDGPNKAHLFICFKTSGPAINVMSVISALFEAVLEKKNLSEREKENKETENGPQTGEKASMGSNQDAIGGSEKNKENEIKKESNLSVLSIVDDPINLLQQTPIQHQPQPAQANKPQKQLSAIAQLESLDLIGDSGIMDADLSFISTSDKPNKSSATVSAAKPIPKLTTQSSILDTDSIFTLPPLSLPRPAPMIPPGPRQNRSLVYNHSSASLCDAALSRQSSYNTPPPRNDNYVDRYAVFNDIDNLPSIFESASLNNVNKSGASMSNPTKPTMFRQTNPFEDDFFN